MGQYLEAFLLGNAAILGNVCLLPLYPGLVALLASRAVGDAEAAAGQDGSATAGDGGGVAVAVRRPAPWLGAVVLAGVLTTMTLIAGALALVNRAFADVLPFVLPVAFGLVAVLGVLMILDRNPLERIGTSEVPILRSPSASAFVYGAALAPMTLPCTGPVILSAFVLGGIGGAGELAEGIAYFLAFGLGFGWPLVVLPLLTGRVQRRFTRFITRHHRAVNVASGVLLIAVAAVGVWVDFLA